MANLGLYTIDSDDSYTLMFNGQRITTISSIVGKTGVTVDENKMKFHGIDIAASAMQYPYVYPKNDNLFFGEVPLLPSGACINITKDDYNRLIAGEVVEGYTRYNQQAIYNIVEDTSNAQTVYYTVDNDVITFDNGAELSVSSDIIYNSVGGELPHNNEDFTATVDNIDFPFLCLKHFDPIIPVGGRINFTYNVDTRDMARLNYDIVDRTFTVIVETENRSIVKKTTYAGVFTVSTPTFNTAGETWFSVRCIDSRGVSSATQYFDILVRNAIQYNTYNMVAADLQPFTYNGETYQIVPNDSTVSTAIANKAALSAFFAKVKNNGYNRVVMLNNTYWVDYHSFVGTQRYWYVQISGATISSVTELTEQDVISNSYTTTEYNKVPVVGQTYSFTGYVYFIVSGVYYQCKVTSGEIVEVKEIDVADVPSTVTPITRNTAPQEGDSYTDLSTTRVLVYNTSTSGDYITFPNEFTIDLNGGSVCATQSNDLNSGYIVCLYNNFDTHIINGYVKGNYENFDFATTKRRCGVGVSGEHLSVIACIGSRYCSFENLNVSGAVGYDGAVGGIIAGTYITPSFSVGGINVNTGDVDTTITGMVVSNLMQISSHYQSLGELSIGRYGYAGYWAGAKRECFFSFYNSLNSHIVTIKGKMYSAIKIPAGATKVRVCGYGTSSQWTVKSGTGPFIMLHKRSKNVLFKGCSWHDTRSCAISSTHAKGVYYENCRFYNIAKETGTYQVTRLLGDFEDGWQWLSDVSFYKCQCTMGSGNDTLKVMYCSNFDFYDNKGVYLWAEGGIESGFVTNNILSTKIERNYRSYHPNVIYDSNLIGVLTVVDGGTVTEPLTMTNTTITNYCSYSKLHLKNSKNGTIKFD